MGSGGESRAPASGGNFPSTLMILLKNFNFKRNEISFPDLLFAVRYIYFYVLIYVCVYVCVWYMCICVVTLAYQH